MTCNFVRMLKDYVKARWVIWLLQKDFASSKDMLLLVLMKEDVLAKKELKPTPVAIHDV